MESTSEKRHTPDGYAGQAHECTQSCISSLLTALVFVPGQGRLAGRRMCAAPHMYIRSHSFPAQRAQRNQHHNSEGEAMRLYAGSCACVASRPCTMNQLAAYRRAFLGLLAAGHTRACSTPWHACSAWATPWPGAGRPLQAAAMRHLQASRLSGFGEGGEKAWCRRTPALGIRMMVTWAGKDMPPPPPHQPCTFSTATTAPALHAQLAMPLSPAKAPDLPAPLHAPQVVKGGAALCVLGPAMCAAAAGAAMLVGGLCAVRGPLERTPPSWPPHPACMAATSCAGVSRAVHLTLGAQLTRLQPHDAQQQTCMQHAWRLCRGQPCPRT